MRKFLLSALATIACICYLEAEEIDITPKNYHFNQAVAIPIFNHGVHGANIQGITGTDGIKPPIFESIKGEEQWNDGLIVIGGGQFWNHDNGFYNNVVKGLQLVDLGGEVGQVLAWIGNESKVKDILKEATGYDYDIKEGCGMAKLNWGNLNFFTDPRNTPGKKQGFIRTTIIYHIVADNISTNAMNNVMIKTNQNDTMIEGGPWSSNGSFRYDDFMEEDIYDHTLWQVYTIDAYCPDSEGDEPVYVPMRATLNFPATMPGVSYFIKDISFTHITDGTPAAESNTKIISLNMGEPNSAGVNNLKMSDAFSYTVNGNTVTFSADTEIFTASGIKIAELIAGSSYDLTSGIYIARAGEKVVKFAVK